MAVKVGNLVTDEKNVQEVLSVEDGKAIVSSIDGGRGASSGASGSTGAGAISFAVTNGDMIVVGGAIDSSYDSIQGVIIKGDGTVKGFSYVGGNSVTVTPES